MQAAGTTEVDASYKISLTGVQFTKETLPSADQPPAFVYVSLDTEAMPAPAFATKKKDSEVEGLILNDGASDYALKYGLKPGKNYITGKSRSPATKLLCKH